ncbi:hypothetical protein D3C78_1972570 [compost metagenome]
MFSMVVVAYMVKSINKATSKAIVAPRMAPWATLKPVLHLPSIMANRKPHARLAITKGSMSGIFF